MKYRKFQLLMSKYGFSLSIMLLELCLVFGLFLYLGRMAPIFMDYCPHSTEYHHNHFDSQP
ncbi:hypothetical protein CGSSp14BS69_08215 [Streptococcus pneumoniae SP14-BS69]|nr:hypothetical protein CGSSp14BS69_08215 [Streptococcus pneumoniae SP14-BS69]